MKLFFGVVITFQRLILALVVYGLHFIKPKHRENHSWLYRASQLLMAGILSYLLGIAITQSSLFMSTTTDEVIFLALWKGVTFLGQNVGAAGYLIFLFSSVPFVIFAILKMMRIDLPKKKRDI